MIWAVSVYAVLGIYAAIGAVFALWFVFAGVARIDEGASAIGFRVRLLLIPGSLALWPLLVARLVSVNRGSL